MPVRIENLILPGSELEPLPIDDRTLVVVRLAAVYPHGTAFRYHLEYQGLEAGHYDLRTLLRRQDGSSLDDLPPLPIVIASVLPAGQVEPHAPVLQKLPWLGGYRLLLVLGAIGWIAGLMALVYPRRGKARAMASLAPQPLSLADRLRTLVRDAREGRLSGTKMAELERALVSYWRHRLQLHDLPPHEALRHLQDHPDAGPLINQLEAWLHRPSSGHVDVEALLAPYENLPSDALEQAQVPAFKQLL